MGGKQRGFKGNRPAGPSQNGGKAFLSMRDEALNTERHSLNRPGLRLRNNNVQFVSAGDLKPDDPALLNEFNHLDIKGESPEGVEQTEDSSPGDEDHGVQPVASAEDLQSADPVISHEENSSIPSEQTPTPLFFIDVEGDPKLRRSERPGPNIRCDSPASMDSSDDEVIFCGRGKQNPVVIEDPVPPSFNSQGIGEVGISHTKPPHHQKTCSSAPGTPDFADVLATPSVNSNVFIPLTKAPRSSKRPSKRPSKRCRFPFEEDDDAILADYIENIMDHPSSDDDSPALDEPVDQPETETGAANRFGGLAMDDQEDLLPGDLAGRARSVPAPVSDAGVVSSPDVSVPEDVEMGGVDNSESSESSSSEQDLEQAPAVQSNGYSLDSGVTVLAENLSFSEIIVTDDDDMEIDYSTVTKKSQRVKRSRPRRTEFPSASAFADALDENPYEAFDIMDFNRPSLRTNARGKSNVPEFDLSDSELEWQLQTSWGNDRKKKKAKKQQREELRAQGSLGNKGGKASVNSGGMKVEEIILEVRSFLLADSERLPLPPMDKTSRKFVHEVANTMSLGSISKGHGVLRFPILTKTTRTPDYNSDSIARFDRLISRNRFLRRIEKSQSQSHRKGKGEPAHSKARGGTKAASYIDGDVVGASAPEIGIENKGRAMLEKMGWTTGTALGAINNKGILQPVAHVVKTSRAGLG